MNASDQVKEMLRQLIAVTEKQKGKDALYALTLALGAVINQAPVDRLVREDMARKAFDLLIDMINRKEKQ